MVKSRSLNRTRQQALGPMRASLRPRLNVSFWKRNVQVWLHHNKVRLVHFFERQALSRNGERLSEKNRRRLVSWRSFFIDARVFVGTKIPAGCRLNATEWQISFVGNCDDRFQLMKMAAKSSLDIGAPLRYFEPLKLFMRKHALSLSSPQTLKARLDLYAQGPARYA